MVGASLDFQWRRDGGRRLAPRHSCISPTCWSGGVSGEEIGARARHWVIAECCVQAKPIRPCCTCGTLIFVRSTTSSFRMSNELRDRLEQAARQLKLGKNSIITRALEEYLEKLNRGKFLEEARRQSILASTSPDKDEEVWLEHADTTGWK